MAKLSDIAGIEVPFEVKLAQSGIRSVETLLKQGSIPHGRKAISIKSGVSEKKILEWVNRADLRRIDNLSASQANLLERAGIYNLTQLAQCRPDQLFRDIIEFNSSENIAPEDPTQNQVEAWVTQARTIQLVVIF